jgi:hypothetical protein
MKKKYVAALVILVLALIAAMYFFTSLSSVEYTSTDSSFTFEYPGGYERMDEEDGSTRIESPIDKSVVVMDWVFRKERIHITPDPTDWESLHFSDTRYEESLTFTRTYLEQLGWNVTPHVVGDAHAFELTRDNFLNIYVIVQKPDGGYLFISDLPMGNEKDLPGLRMILRTLRFSDQ